MSTDKSPEEIRERTWRLRELQHQAVASERDHLRERVLDLEDRLRRSQANALRLRAKWLESEERAKTQHPHTKVK